MEIYSIGTVHFIKENSIMYTFELIEGDRIALNHVPINVCELYYNSNANEQLSFVIYDMKTLEDYSFAILKESNKDNREHGAEILAIGYSSDESYRDLMQQLRFHVFSFMIDGHYQYNYIWANNIRFTDSAALRTKNYCSVLER